MREREAFISLAKLHPHLVANCGVAVNKLLTRNDPVSVLQSMEVVHELLYGDFKGLKKTCVLKKPVRNLGHNKIVSRLCGLCFIAGTQVSHTVVHVYLTEDAAGFTLSFLHQFENREVPASELTNQRLQSWHQQRL